MSDILTETQALTKWCPMARIWESNLEGEGEGYAAAAINRPDASMHCIAAKCMAWRTVYSDAAGEPRGFCGAFGKPAGA